MTIGRPPKFNIDEHPKVAREMLGNGSTFIQLAEALGISRNTVTDWIDKHPAFRAAIAQGKNDAIDSVEQALHKRAIGYSHPTEKIIVIDGEVERVKTTEHYPADPHCIKFFLSNKRSQDWREKTAVEHSGHLTLADLLTDPKTVTPPEEKKT